MGKSNQINMNSKVDENKDEDEDVVVVTSIITPTITTSNTTIRQQDHLRSLHIVSRWDANYTKKRYTNTHDDNNDHQYQGLLFDPDKRGSSILDYCNHNHNNNNSSNIYVDRPPIGPVRRR